MTWDTERALAGKRPFNFIAIAVNRCRHTYADGVGSPSSGACFARLGVTGDDKCHNSWETCQDVDNFDPRDYWLRFCEAVADIPLVFDFSNGSPTEEGLDNFVPLLRSFTHDPAMPDPGESLGVRVRFTAQLEDAPHHDIGVDKYALERVTGEASVGSPTGVGYDPMERGTFLRKLKARFPHYVGRSLRWYQGYITDSPSLSDFRCRHYVMEKVTGPDASGRMSIIANDVLRLLDDERSQAPRKSSGELAFDMEAGGSPAVSAFDVTTDDATQYDLASGETVDYVRIGNEIFTYTGTTAIAGGVRLTGVTRAAPSPYSTTADDHEAGDLVQRCLLMRGTVPAVVSRLMTEFGGVPADFIPTSDWNAEANTWAPEEIERLITEPEGVKSLINEIIGQTLTWGFWFDEIDQEVKFRAIRPADLNEDIPELTDEANIVAGSVQVVDTPDKLINEVQVLFGQIDPTGDDDDVENYRRGLLDRSTDSQSANESGQKRIKRIFARWHPTSNSGVVAQFARRTVNARSKVLFEVQFALERKDESVRSSQFCDLTTIYVLTALGAPRTVRVQVLQAKADGEEVTYRAREDFFREAYGRLAPGGTSPSDLDGLLWTDATAAQRERYFFLAQADGTFTNGDRGKALA
jgi:hypothetical protein